MSNSNPPTIAFVSDSGSKVAWVFGPGYFSAVRSLDGTWRSPAPKVHAGDFVSDGGYDRASDAETAALLEEARAAAQRPRQGPSAISHFERARQVAAAQASQVAEEWCRALNERRPERSPSPPPTSLSAVCATKS